MKKISVIFSLVAIAMLVSCSSPVSTDEEVEVSKPTTTVEVPEEETPEEVEETPEEIPEEIPEEPTEDLAVAADGEFGVAYIYLPDEEVYTKKLSSLGYPSKDSSAEYRLELVKTAARKEGVNDTISIYGNKFENICDTLNVYKVYVSRNTTETEFYIRPKADLVLTMNSDDRIVYKVVKTDNNWYLSTMIFNYTTDLKFTDFVITQFEDFE